MAPTPAPVSTRSERFYDRASVATLLLLLLIACLTYRDYGVTWDETYHLMYGFHITRFWGTGFTDLTAVTYRIDYLYGGGFDATATAFRSFARPFVERFDAVHLFGSLVGIAGIAGTWKLGRVLGGPRVGFIATLMMATTSVYYGHMFNNPKDLPFAAGYAWGLYFLFRLIQEFPRVPRALAIKAAIAFGLAMAVRIGGLLLVCYFAMAIALWLLHQGWIRRNAEHAYRLALKLLPRSVAIVAGGWAIMLIWWPWALLDPIRRPLAALTRMAEFIDHRRWMPFAGEEVYNLDPPWDYLIHYFGLKMPEYVVAGFVFASFFALFAVFSDGFRRMPFTRQLTLGLLAFSIWFPPVYAVYKDSPLYDGLRHFLFIIPPIIGAVALVVDGGLAAAQRRFGRAGLTVVWALFAVAVGDQAATMARLHPHQYVYFNRFIGGLEGAVGQYSTDYYAQTYKESAEKLGAKIWADEKETYLDTVYVVGGCIGQMRALRYLPRNFKWRKPGGTYDFDISYTRGDCTERHPDSPVITRVERDGGLLNQGQDLRQQIVPADEFSRLKLFEKRNDPTKKKNRNKNKRPRPKKPRKGRRTTGTGERPRTKVPEHSRGADKGRVDP